MAHARYIVGIDLGTTNSAVATIDTSSSKTIEMLAIDQLVAAGEVAPKPLLPSALYLPNANELKPGDTKLPWAEPPYVVGLFAREQGARVPGRVVTSAKSWLCHPRVDRTAAILPWGAPADVSRVSPVEASARYLQHLKAAWELRHPGFGLDEQELVLTVPASFDEGARELTVEAARLAGLGHATLIEEPLAAFYHWLSGHPTDLDAQLDGVSLALVIDVGGGTTDLTLIQVQKTPEGPRLDRIAVGDHLLLGGDNMDLAIAKVAETKLGSGALDAASWGALVESSRAAKEALLAENAPETRSVTILGRSSKLLGGTRKVELERDAIRSLVLDGFFPTVSSDARPERRAGLKELGLPYATDAAITKHVAAFLARHLVDGQVVDAVLFNGGALHPKVIGERLLDVLGEWSGKRPKLLVNDALDLAVARGAAQFGLVRRGEGVRVGGGSPRAYFLDVHTAEGSQGLCLVPRGSPEGQLLPLGGREFTLTTGKPVRFEIHSSTSRRSARPGDLVPLDGDDLVQLPPIQTVVKAASNGPADVRVKLEAGTTEIGTLAVFCVAGSERYKLEFQLRGGSDDRTVYVTQSVPAKFAEIRELVEKFYGRKPAPDMDAKAVKNLGREIEKALGPRETWSLPVLRELWSVLWGGAARRRRTADHERQWFMLTGYALRPGFGAPLDDWRVRETFSLFSQGLQFHQEKPAWDQWWILWRRVAGGLDEASQVAIVEAARPYLEPITPGKTKPRPKGPKAEGIEEMVRLVASLERLPPLLKNDVGEWLWARHGAGQLNSLWVFGRLGGRAPFYGSAHQVLPAELAEVWIERLLRLDWNKAEGAGFAATLIARMTGDRARDLSDDVRAKVLEKLTAAKAHPHWIAMVREPTVLEAADEQKIFGESLPTGLKLVG